MASYGRSYTKPATRSEPCIICGKTDHCFRSFWGSDGVLIHCAKNKGSDVIGRDGQEYYLKRENAGYFVYESKEQREQQRQAYIEEQKRLNPNFKYRGRSYNPKPVAAKEEAEKPYVEVDHVDPLSNKRLHEIYSYLLSLLILEDEHKKALLDEWDSGSVYPHLGEDLLQRWPIRSLPMNDRARKASGTRLKNKTRRQIITEMVKKFGSLKGVPGFFLETTHYTDYRTGEPVTDTHWQMVSLSGIVYPCYDQDGYLYRIRVGDEHPAIKEYARDATGAIIYEETISKTYDKQGHCTEHIRKNPTYRADYRWDKRTGEWIRKDYATGKEQIVYSKQKNIYLVNLTSKGYPVVDGKVDGKYKNFSSHYRKEVEQEDKILVYNGYTDGCQSGSPFSLYTKKGDNMQFVYITEGEKKAMVINACLNCPVISLPGVHTSSKIFDEGEGAHLHMSLISYLLSIGMKAIIVVYDSDKAVNDAVLAAEQTVITQCKERGILVYSANWNPMFGKGADDVLIIGKTFEFYLW